MRVREAERFLVIPGPMEFRAYQGLAALWYPVTVSGFLVTLAESARYLVPVLAPLEFPEGCRVRTVQFVLVALLVLSDKVGDLHFDLAPCAGLGIRVCALAIVHLLV